VEVKTFFAKRVYMEELETIKRPQPIIRPRDSGIGSIALQVYDKRSDWNRARIEGRRRIELIEIEDDEHDLFALTTGENLC